MNYDKYNEVINGDFTYKKIAEEVIENEICIIGWTDEDYDHRDILFIYQLIPKYGTLQRGLNWNHHLYIGIIPDKIFGFLIESDRDNRQHEGYLKEKLNLYDNSCDDKICELINGVINEIDKLEGRFMNKIYLLLYNKESHKQFFKYFDTEYEKDKFKRKLKYSKKIMIIEDSTDIIYEENYR